MTEPDLPSMAIHPAMAVRRQVDVWGGLVAEAIHVAPEPIEYRFRGRHHLLTMSERAVRVAGDTRVDGLPASSLRDFSGKMCFVPAGSDFRGSFVPGEPPRNTYFYLDPAALPVDPDSRFAERTFEPRLFFDDPALWSTAAKLGRLIGTPAASSRLYAEALASVLAIELVRLVDGQAAPPPRIRGGLAAWQQRRVCDYLEVHLGDPVSLATLAGLAGLSPTHFCRAFKQSLGSAPHRYQLERRIAQAKRLLAQSQRPIAEIAAVCGFGYASNFTSAFRKVAGTTPAAFRRALE